ncbi:four helix bundle protein [Echinicola soli]|uniref:four helix bundle protein n=1 Tax=Echinicola soli TaxID=2591634 RepID=UPI0021D14533|nr:four helix bundle protein [Echinicola soli]
MHNYKEFKVWQKAIKVIVDVYRITRFFPTEEKFGLISQMRSCGVSVASNISEGAGIKKRQGIFSLFVRMEWFSL